MWLIAYQQLDQIRGGVVKRRNLQCYAGGRWNSPQVLVDFLAGNGFSVTAAGLLTSPGLADNLNAPNGCSEYTTPDQIQSQFSAHGWKGNGIHSAWVWRYDDIARSESSCHNGAGGSDQDYQQVLVNGLNSI